MIWVYFGAILVCALIWILGVFIFLDWWQIILLNIAVIAIVGIILLVRRWRTARAALALEKQMMEGAEKQKQNTRPDRRGEIGALQDTMKSGIAALKKTRGGRRALATLPWYVIIGPPGAGKTTALKQSGLDFPLEDGRGAGARGVGGTRNCEWWFTNDAILLDTAGRYTTEQDDREEWMSFLDMLRRFRSQPINGVFVAVSLADLAQATEEQIEFHAKNLRARIDELMVRLQMVVPVYVMLTKADLTSGFVEFFGDLRKSERGQIWGVTFPIVRPVNWDCEKAVEQEFELLVQTLHARAIRRVGGERQMEQRPKILQFPLEFQLLKKSVAQFVSILMRPNVYQENPLLRGVYFTSGTQEGRPIDRVLGSMAQAFGLQPAQMPMPAPSLEQKSYFVTDLFKQVAFPDRGLAHRHRTSRRIGPR